MNYKFKAKRPKREQLHGLSPSELKTLLKRRGYKVPKDFFKYGSLARYNGRSYRFRWYSDGEFFVDKSCPRLEFDRWANSVDEVIPFSIWLKNHD
jgi:hypothetical protein